MNNEYSNVIMLKNAQESKGIRIENLKITVTSNMPSDEAIHNFNQELSKLSACNLLGHAASIEEMSNIA